MPHVARLLVSVRSEIEALAALAGGAAIIDVKEPSRGSLGMAPCSTWRQIREAMPPPVIVSVALGELREWTGSTAEVVPGACWDGIAFRKVGLAGSGTAWREHWRDLRGRMDAELESVNADGRPSWVAVVYLDWEAARAPAPVAVIDEAAAIPDCAGVLFDTWDKARRVEFDPTWASWIGRAKASGRFVALAGSLDEAKIRRLLPLGPDIFAVRGAACAAGDRNGPIDPGRVARLVLAARQDSQASPMSNRTPWASGSSRP